MPRVEREFELLFPTVMQITKIAEHSQMNDQLMREIGEVRATTPNGRPVSWSCDVYTTISNNYLLHERPGFRRLNRHFIDNAERYGRALEYPMHNHEVQMDMCWLNAYRRGHSQERHNHINYVFSGIYYLKAPRGASTLMVHAPTADVMMAPRVREQTDLNTSYVEIEPEEGMMLIFSGTLRHAVRASNIDDERISIAMNANLIRRHSS